MEITIKITGLEGITGALNRFADVLLAKDSATAVEPPVQQPTTQQPPVQQPQVQQPHVPVSNSVPTYTQDQMAIAMTTLVDAGKSAILQQIMTGLGVNFLGELPQSRYPELVAKLREQGVNV